MTDRLNPITLRDIRVRRKVSVDELAEWLGTSTDRVEKFESGGANPTIRQLRKMSQAFKVPLYTYKSGFSPNLDPIPDDFRKRDPNQADLTPAGLARLWSVERIADFTNELILGLQDEAPSTTRLPVSKLVAAASPEDMRQRVNDWVARHGSVLAREQSDALTFAKRFRLYIERHGCMIAFDDAPSSDYLGFYKKFNARTPVAFVNRRVGSQKAALFTLAHEWCHYLSDAEGISDPWVAKNAVERACNQFAARFLAPEDEIKAFIDRIWTSKTSPEDIAGKLSRASLLSFRASAIRLQELGYLKQIQVSSFFKRTPSHTEFDNETDPAPKRSGGNVYSAAGRRLAEVGTYACVIAAAAAKKGLIDEIDIAQSLRISPGLQPYVFSMAKKRFELDGA